MNALELIRKKHAGGALSAAEIEWLVNGAVSGVVPDYQLGALLMAICYEHLNFDETVALTRAFVGSGATITLPVTGARPGELSSPTAPDRRAGSAPREPREAGAYIDKHSTGGVGDKVSLILLPLLASLGFKVAKMSGRALGHTGGTIDKLESIPGFRTNLTRAEMLRVVDEVGCCIVEQSADLVPADKKLYALRDSTDTVGELGLIAASVMSKKIACGAPLIVLDVKCGSGAFFKTLPEARALAELAKRIGEHFGRRVGCVISSMEQPLGQAVGNAIEVLEVLMFLDHDRWAASHPGAWQRPPHQLTDVHELVAVLASASIHLAAKPEWSGNPLGPLQDGLTLNRFKRWITAQGGDLAAFVDKYADYFATQGIPVAAPSDGFIQAVSTDHLGATLAALGAGRSQAGEAVDHKVGLLCHARIGDQVSAGDKLATLFLGSSQRDPGDAARAVAAAFQIADTPVTAPPIILDRIL